MKNIFVYVFNKNRKSIKLLEEFYIYDSLKDKFEYVKIKNGEVKQDE